MGILKKNKKSDIHVKLFEEQLHPIYKDLYRFIYSILRNTVLAEDALQNALEKAYKSFENLEKQNSFKSWIFSIAKNEAITIIRQYQRESFMDISEPQEFFQDQEPLPEEFMMQQEVREQVIEIINDLKPKYRDLITLRYYGDLTLEEIAMVLNVNINTVKTRHKRAKDKIKKELKVNISLQDKINNYLTEGGGVDA